MNNIVYWLWLTIRVELSRKKIYHLLEEYDTPEKIYDLSGNELSKKKYLTDQEMLKLADKDLSGLEQFVEMLKKNRVTILTIDSKEYPESLKTIDDAPLVLYCRGKFIDLNQHFCVSIVGTRNMTEYGSTVAHNIAYNLAKEGIVIISGMAEGIDARAHEGALKANMPTVAVLGCGVNLVYPRSNAKLMKRIIETGMVISEYPLNSEPLKYHFPERNRIISGLSSGTVVVEAGIKSGSMITVNFANEQGRDVFAVPGNVNSTMSQGPNHMIKDGAIVVTSAEDIIDQYNIEFVGKVRDEKHEINDMRLEIDDSNYIQEVKMKNMKVTKVSVMTDEEAILSAMSHTPIGVDELSDMTGIIIPKLKSKLLLLALDGKVTELPGNNYVLVKDD